LHRDAPDATWAPSAGHAAAAAAIISLLTVGKCVREREMLLGARCGVCGALGMNAPADAFAVGSPSFPPPELELALQFSHMDQNVFPKPFAQRGPDHKKQSKNESPKRKRSKARVRICANGATKSCFCRSAVALMIAVARSLRLVAGEAGASAAAAPKSGASTAPATMTAGSVMTGDTWVGARARA
jgi:hypothetical protein